MRSAFLFVSVLVFVGQSLQYEFLSKWRRFTRELFPEQQECQELSSWSMVLKA